MIDDPSLPRFTPSFNVTRTVNDEFVFLTLPVAWFHARPAKDGWELLETLASVARKRLRDAYGDSEISIRNVDINAHDLITGEMRFPLKNGTCGEWMSFSMSLDGDYIDLHEYGD